MPSATDRHHRWCVVSLLWYLLERTGCMLGFNQNSAAPRSVMFNFLGRDFFNALAEKDADRFYGMIVKWLCALCVGIPVFVFRDYYQARLSLRARRMWSFSLWLHVARGRWATAALPPGASSMTVCGLPQSKLALEWREWLTRRVTNDYFRDRSFYQIQAGTLVDNPDQRISSDIRCSPPCSFPNAAAFMTTPLQLQLTCVTTDRARKQRCFRWLAVSCQLDW